MQISKRAEPKLRRCIFVGPSLKDAEMDRRIARFGPAQLGSIYLAAKAGFRIIGLVDGIFGNVPTVWHKEILYALAQGCVVCGSASIGALRAAELHAYGMHGIGLCYRLFRAEVITDDDEVAVLHGDAITNYAHFSEPLINARLTLRALRQRELLSSEQEIQIISGFKALHFSERTFAKYRETLISAFGAREGNRIHKLFQSRYRDLKREDAEELVRYLLNAHRAPVRSKFFIRTGPWREQFEEMENALRPLQ